jgi:hypothetical protein
MWLWERMGSCNSGTPGSSNTKTIVEFVVPGLTD